MKPHTGFFLRSTSAQGRTQLAVSMSHPYLCTCTRSFRCQPHLTGTAWHLADRVGSGPYSHWMYHALHITLLSRILSQQSSRSPLKFFHFGDTSFPLKHQAKGKLRDTTLKDAMGLPAWWQVRSRYSHVAPLQVLARHLWEHPQEHSKLLHTLGAAQT